MLSQHTSSSSSFSAVPVTLSPVTPVLPPSVPLLLPEKKSTEEDFGIEREEGVWRRGAGGGEKGTQNHGLVTTGKNRECEEEEE